MTRCMTLPLPISIHPPRAGWDAGGLTSALSGADFNPPTPCGVGLVEKAFSRKTEYFNPPTPCGVGRHVGQIAVPGLQFQSTHPVRGGTIMLGNLDVSNIISIHPPRAGWDIHSGPLCVACDDFNPPTPCGVGLLSIPVLALPATFQSTHPVRGGTRKDS